MKTNTQKPIQVDIQENADAKFRMNLPSYEGGNPYIFISYSHADTKAIRPILERLALENYRFWYDDTMEIGEDFREELRTKIERCSAFMLFISKSSMASKYCGMEIITAYKNNKKIYPVYLDEQVEIPAALKMVLENLQHLKGDIIEKGDEKHLRKLIEGLPFETKRSLRSNNYVITKCMDGSKNIRINPGLVAIGEGAFKDCTTMETIELGDDIEELRKESFRGCRNLKAIRLHRRVRNVGDSAFRDCVSMESLWVENKDIEIGERAFENCAALHDIELPSGMTEIYGGAFNSCKSLENIVLPEELNVMGESCFADCVKLSKVDVPPHVSKIDDMVFSGCINLCKIELPYGLTKIGKHAFKDCSSLERIRIPATVNNIGSGAFRGCSSLQEIDVDPKSRSFKSVDGILFNKNKSVLLGYPALKEDRSYTIPDSVTVISDWSICENRNLVNVIIPDSVQEIGEGAFHMCTQLQDVVIPDSVTSIDDAAFRGCSSLKRITIPDSVTEFGWGIFSGCDPTLMVVCSPHSEAAKYCDDRKINHSDK